MSEPLVVVNCKTYASASGLASTTLVDALANVNSDGVRLVLAVSAFDLHALATAHPTSNSGPNISILLVKAPSPDGSSLKRQWSVVRLGR